MPFGLKNTGATYKRLVNKMFRDHIGKSMEVYMGDMLVKSRKNEVIYQISVPLSRSSNII